MPPRRHRAVAIVAAFAVLAVAAVLWHLRPSRDAPFTAEPVGAVLTLRAMNPLEPYPFDIPDLDRRRDVAAG